MYAKIFTQIFDSSIADNWKHRHVFEDMLKLCNRDGVVDMTFEAVSKRTRIPLPIVRAAIEFLSRPDPDSRTREEEGRRLVPIDPLRRWGWRVVNYQKYREMKTDRDRTEYMREYMRNRRKSAVVLTPGVNNGLTRANPASASASISPLYQGRGVGEGAVELPKGFPSTEQEALKIAEFVPGASPEFGLKIWNKAMSRNGEDSKGVPIRSFRHYLATELNYELEHQRKANAQPSAASSRGNRSQPDYSKGF